MTSKVTNGEYAAFVRAGGYEKRELWCHEGWRWLTRKQPTTNVGQHETGNSVDEAARTAPRYWYKVTDDDDERNVNIVDNVDNVGAGAGAGAGGRANIRGNSSSSSSSSSGSHAQAMSMTTVRGWRSSKFDNPKALLYIDHPVIHVSWYVRGNSPPPPTIHFSVLYHPKHMLTPPLERDESY